MADCPPPTAVFMHRSVDADGLSIHVAEFREAQRVDTERPGILFLHGWPETWSAFQGLISAPALCLWPRFDGIEALGCVPHPSARTKTDAVGSLT